MNEDELYELADEAPAKASRAAPAKAGAGADLPQAQQAIPSIGYKSPVAIGTSEPERLFADRQKDLYLPLGLIVGGLVIEAVLVLLQRDPFGLLFERLRATGMRLCLSAVLMMAGIALASRLRHFKLGPLPVAMMKVCAIAIGPGAVGAFFRPLALLIPLFGSLTVAVIEFCLFFALIGVFFDLDQDDTWYCVCIIFVIHISIVLAGIWVV